MDILGYRGTIFEPGSAEECKRCKGRGWVRKPKTDPPEEQCCPRCGGTSVSPLEPFTSPWLKSHQLLLPTYNPAYVARHAPKGRSAESDFRRIRGLHQELKSQPVVLDYNPLPSTAQLERLVSADRLSLDLETSGLGSDARITHFGATDRIKAGSIIPLERRDLIERAMATDELVGQNWLLYDAWVLHCNGYRRTGGETGFNRLWDTRLVGHLLRPDTSNALTSLVQEYAQPPVRGFWKTEEAYATAGAKAQTCMIDVDVTLRVKLGQEAALEASGQRYIVENDIIPLCNVLFDMRVRGMRIARGRSAQALDNLAAQLEEGRAQLPDWGGVGTENQHKKVQEHLYETLELPVQRKRNEGRPVTADEGALEKLYSYVAQGHRQVKHLSHEQAGEALKFIDLVQRLRDLSKLRGYIKGFQDLPADDMVHPAWNPGGSTKNRGAADGGTATMRLTCTDPPAQVFSKCECKPKCVPYSRDGVAIPRKPGCKEMRYLILPDHDDWEIMEGDLSQAEVVVALWYGELWGILDQVLNRGMDTYDMMSDLAGIDRQAAKIQTLALIYGEGPETTALRTNRPVAEVKQQREAFYRQLPGLQDFREETIDFCMANGYVESPFGHRRYIMLTKRTGRAANQACNAPIQNSPAMWIRRCMIRLHRELPAPARLLFNKHDSIGVTYPRELREQVKQCMLDVLSSPVKELRWPKQKEGLRFKVKLEAGPDWGSLREV